MTLRAIRLERFRGFEQVELELRPLTVLLGANSAGKSSFGHALAAMSHAHRVFAGTPQASLTPTNPQDALAWPVDLGSTSDLRTFGTEGNVRIGLLTSAGWVELGFGIEPHARDLRLSYVAHPRADTSKPLVAPSSSDRISTKGPWSGADNVRHIEQPVDARPAIVQRVNELQWQAQSRAVSVLWDGLIVKAIQHESGTTEVLSHVAREELRRLFERVIYLRATRERPTRTFDSRIGRIQKLGYAGECVAAVLMEAMERTVHFGVPPAIPTSLEEARSATKVWTQTEKPLLEALGEWLVRLDLAQSLRVMNSEEEKGRLKVMVKLDGQEEHNLTEMGFGISQIVPVLAAGLMQPSDSLFVVDLPEAHLHPRPQAAVADFFCSMAMSGRQSIVETHSEMFFHRLRLRAQMSPALADRIAVYFLDPPKDGICSPPRPVGLNEDAELIWPPRFLQEGWEMENQIGFLRKASQTK